jgi:hypothetical protein
MDHTVGFGALHVKPPHIPYLLTPISALGSPRIGLLDLTRSQRYKDYGRVLNSSPFEQSDFYSSWLRLSHSSKMPAITVSMPLSDVLSGTRHDPISSILTL